MNAKKLFCCYLTLWLIGVFSVAAQSSKQPAKKPRPQPVPAPSNETMTLLRQAQATAEQAQSEARRAREQNETLQRQLASNTEELAHLRETITAFGAQLAALKMPEPKPTTEHVTAPAPLAVSALESVKTEVETLKEQVEVHTAQIKEHAQTKVETESKLRVKLHGMILANTYYNTNDSTLNDVPLFAAQPSAVPRKNNLGATLRQSRFGFTMDGPRLSQHLGSARLSAEAEFDFWAGENADVLGELRIITASARLDWERTSFVVGQRPPLISPRNPTSTRRSGLPLFIKPETSGNGVRKSRWNSVCERAQIQNCNCKAAS